MVCGDVLASNQDNTPMPLDFEHDDQRRLVTITVTEPYSPEDLVAAIERLAHEDLWEYAAFYDLRGTTRLPNEGDLEQIADRVKAVGSGRERGPVGIAIRAQPALFLASLTYTHLTKEFMVVEVLLTSAQVDAWMARNAQRRT